MKDSFIKKRFLPIGAEIFSKGVHFRVWTSDCKKVTLIIESSRSIALHQEANGYFSVFVPGLAAGARYFYQLDNNPLLLPDPASRFQPEGPHGPSEVIDSSFPWSDSQWKGIDKKKAIIYELHIGTFTQEGTWVSATQQLDYLKELGITVIEIMPIAEFAGNFGWGYDGVDLFAPLHVYGSPYELKYFINRAHQLDIGVILDVVYNHLGPDGNYLNQFSPLYFSKKYTTDWGWAINFEENAQSIREYFLANAIYWIEEFHFDGLRLDASQNIYDTSTLHIIQEMTQTLRTRSNRLLYLIAENEPQDTRFIQPVPKNGFGLDALWNDDFHHTANVVLTSKREAYHIDYRGSAQELLSGFKYSFLYQGQWYIWHKKPRGTPTFGFDPSCFINYLQNHDQIANSAYGERIHKIASPGLLRVMTAFLLLSLQTPLLFQGQEFAASTPFRYFADHKPEIAKKIYQGRIQFFKQFRSIMSPEMRASLPNPCDPLIFNYCKLKEEEVKENEPIFLLHKDLINLRKNDPVFNRDIISFCDGALLNKDAFLLRFIGTEERLMLVNLGNTFTLDTMSEPLIAPPLGNIWEIFWSSENPKYGGSGIVKPTKKGPWQIQGQSLTLFFNKKA